jgi:hypothetical protein
MSYKIVNFTKDISSTATTVVTGVGFMPKAVMFFFGLTTGSKNVAGVGVDDGTNSGLYAINLALSPPGNYSNGNNSLIVGPDFGSFLLGHITAWSNDGFTISWASSGTPSGTYQIFALCFSCLAKVTTFARDRTVNTGAVAYTGIGFQPTALVMFGSTANGAADASSYGVGDDVTCGAWDTNFAGASPNNLASLNLTVCGQDWGNFQSIANVTFQSDGFTLGWQQNGSPTGTGQYVVLALGGMKAKVLAHTRDMSLASGSVGYTGYGFRPQCLITPMSNTTAAPNLSCFGVSGFDPTIRAVLATSVASDLIQDVSGNFLAGGPDFSNYQLGQPASYDADGYTISWVKGGSPTGTWTWYSLALGPTQQQVTARFAGAGTLAKQDLDLRERVTTVFAASTSLSCNATFPPRIFQATAVFAAATTLAGSARQAQIALPEVFDPITGLSALARQAQSALPEVFDSVTALSLDVDQRQRVTSALVGDTTLSCDATKSAGANVWQASAVFAGATSLSA